VWLARATTLPVVHLRPVRSPAITPRS
jgi:hypothetical protein